jgi:hypothetical protein
MRYGSKRDTLACSMTVADLIMALEDMSPTAKVVFASDYGDIGHTVQALTLMGVDTCDYADITESAYSNSGLAISDNSDDDGEEGSDGDNDGDNDNDNEEQVVVLR